MKNPETERDEFIAELRSKLLPQITAIKLQVAALLNQRLGSLNDKQNEFLKIANESVDKLAAVIDNISEITGIQAKRVKFNRRRVSIRSLLKLAIDHYQNIAEQRTLNVNCPQDASIFIDVERISRVFNNLLEHAVRSTQPDGVIRINVVIAQDNLTVTFQTNGIQLIKDDEVGKPGEESALAYNRLLIESQQGTLSAAPEPGQDFQYVITFPLYEFEFALKASFQELMDSMERFGENIALVALNCETLSQSKSMDEMIGAIRKNIYKDDYVIEKPPHLIVILSLTNAEGARTIFLRMKKLFDNNILGGIQLYPTDGMDIMRLLSQATDKADFRKTS